MTVATVTPGSILEDTVRKRGWSEFTIEVIDPETGVNYDCVDLGNGNQVYGFISQMTDSVIADSEGVVDFAACNFQDWTNISPRYTRQQGVSDFMHDSEYLGGGMADDVSSTPGEYVMAPVNWQCDEWCEECKGEAVNAAGEYCETTIEGWIILHREI